MAEYDPAHQGGDWNENEGYEEHGEHDQQEDIQQHSTHQDEAEYPIAPNALGDGSSQDGSADDVGDYDPTSVTSAPVLDSSLQTPAEGDAPRKQPSPQAFAKKSRSVGGFVVGDSDDEDSDSDDQDAPVAASGGPAPGPSPLPIVSHPAANNGTPSNESPAPQVNKPVDEPAQDTSDASPQPAAPAPAPTDRITFLEARVTDDPRGAMDEWLGLFQEYRNRGDIENLRKAYSRFVAVFPQAVSPRNLCLSRTPS